MELSDENRAKFDADKAWKFFQSIENLPYGLENILFSFLDTREGNVLQIASLEGALVYANILDGYSFGVSVFDKLVGDALNNRLKTEGLNYKELVYEAERQGTSIIKLLLIPEKEGLLYGKGEVRSVRYICSAMVVATFMRAGLLGGKTILPNEFSPKDVY